MKYIRNIAMFAFIVGMVLSVYALQSSAQEAVGGGDIIYEGGGLGQVTFSHDTHMAREGVVCTDCHVEVFAMATGEPGTLTMEVINAGGECGTCHNDTGPGFAATACMDCHVPAP